MRSKPQTKENKKVSMGDKLKFLMVTTFYPPYNFGGDGIFIYRLSNELARRGHTVDVLYCIDAYEILQKQDPQGEYPNHPNITIHPLKSPVGFLSPLLTQQTSYSFFKRQKIQSLLTEKQFDIIHYHNISLLGLDVLTYGNAIKFYTLHEYWLICPMHMLWKYGREVCTKRNCLSCQIVGKRPIQWWRYIGRMPRALSHIDTFISPSIFTKRKHHERGLDVPIAHIPHFVPTAASSEECAENLFYPHNRPYFLFVGRLEKMKGVQNLLAVFRHYTPCDLLVAGDGEYAATLHALAADMPHIKFLGRLSYQELRPLYRYALAVIVPSSWYEVFGMIVIEAFTMGTPVIVHNAGALPELVQQSGGGFIYHHDNELLEHLEKLRLHPDLRQAVGTKGYQAYRKYWTEYAYLTRYYQLIQEIAAQKKITNPAIDALQDELTKQNK
jgi:glycosyltransferase involved in cell wall biosynthesis